MMARECESFNEKKRFDRSGPNRLPMNAFLINCKRERSSVKPKCSFLEGDQVLGKWWASLGSNDKSKCSQPSSQHKENYMRTMTAVKSRIPQPVIIPGKLADESQLGGLSSLLLKEVVIQEEKRPPLPIPLKKRYRNEVYLSTDLQPPSVVETKIETAAEIKTETGPIGEEREDKRLKTWQSHILEENNNVKEPRARACKGQRYREFMWSSLVSRRKANRWELNQDKLHSPAPKKNKTSKNIKNKTRKSTKISNGKSITSPRSVPEQSNDIIHHSSQLTAKEEEICESSKWSGTIISVSSIINPPSSNGLQTSCDNHQTDVEPAQFEANNNNKIAPTEESKKPEPIIGCRKRKIRTKEIRRLTPGSTFNGIVV